MKWISKINEVSKIQLVLRPFTLSYYVALAICLVPCLVLSMMCMNA